MGGVALYTSLLLGALTLCTAYSTHYHGYQQWKVTNIAENKVDDVRGILRSFQLDVVGTKGKDIEFVVEPKIQKILGKTLSGQGFHYEITVMDLQSLIDDELKRLSAKTSVGIDFEDFNDYDTIVTYIHDLADQVEWVTVESIGQSIEGRDLWVTTLSVPSLASKPSIWMDCGIHAREWLTEAVCVYGLNYLTTSYGTVDDVTNFLDKYDVRIMPVYNVDGYVYSWDEDRYWRKNRVDTDVAECKGVDLNRNCDDGHWDGPYSGDFACDTDYRGASVFSELETQAVRDYIGKLDTIPTAYFNMHTYGEYWMHAIGFTYDFPPEQEDLERVTKTGVDALEAVHGERFDYGPVSTTLYPVNGDVLDWAYTNGIIYAFVMELRGSGFIISADQITPAGEETWAGVMAAVMAI